MRNFCVALVAAAASLATNLGNADDFLKNGVYMSQAIRAGNLPRMQKLLESPYIEPQGYLLKNDWNSYLFDALDDIYKDKGYDVLEVVSQWDYKLPDRALNNRPCTDAEKVIVRVVDRDSISPSRAIEIVRKNTDIAFNAKLSCLGNYGSYANFGIAFSRRGEPAYEIQYLFNLDHNPTAQSATGDTATHFAVWTQRPEVMKALLDSGAPFLVKNNFGALPIDVVNCHPPSRENAEMREMLIAKGSPVPGPPDPLMCRR